VFEYSFQLPIAGYVEISVVADSEKDARTQLDNCQDEIYDVIKANGYTLEVNLDQANVKLVTIKDFWEDSNDQ